MSLPYPVRTEFVKSSPKLQQGSLDLHNRLEEEAGRGTSSRGPSAASYLSASSKKGDCLQSRT